MKPITKISMIFSNFSTIFVISLLIFSKSFRKLSSFWLEIQDFRLDDEKQLSCYLHRDSTEEDIDSQLVHLFNYLSDLFNNKTVAVWIRPSLVETSHVLFSNLQFESCQLLKILEDDPLILSNEDMTRLLEVWKPTIGITIKCSVEENFGPRNVSLYCFFWIVFFYIPTDSESPTALYYQCSMGHFRWSTKHGM